MFNWNRKKQIDFDEYMRLSNKSNKRDFLIINEAPNCNYCYFCHESVGGGYRVLVNKDNKITEVLCCYGCYPRMMDIKK